MRESIDFETTPVEESCEQFPYVDGGRKARKEALAFINQLKRKFGEQFGTRFKIKSNPYDLPGNTGGVSFYLSVELVFDDADPQSVEYTYGVDNDLPMKWDEEALAELAK